MIRRHRPEDVSALLEVWERASEVGHPFLDAGFLAAERTAIRDVYLHRSETWLYEAEGEVVGYLALIGDEIGALFVHPDRHGQGIGRALVDHALELRGHLEVEVFSENAVGRRFYERYGFVPLREYRHEPTGRLMLRLALPRKG